jgi:subtilisin family serine protease
VHSEFLVKFEAGNSPAVLAQMEAGMTAQVVDSIPQLGVDVIRVVAGISADALEAVRRLPGVAYAEPNYRVQIMETLNDPDVPVQWHLEAIGASDAWDIATGEGVIIAVVDTGADPGEPDLKDKLAPGYDFVNNDSAPWDDQGHGTRIALIAAGAANNGYGGAGVAYNARVMPLKAMDNTGAGTHDWISKAIIWAADNGADIINLSIGGPYPSQTLRDAINYAWRRGVLLVAAAGNESSDVPVYPAAFDHVLAVAGTTDSRERAIFSNWGDHIGVAAPGTNILVNSGGNHQLGNGTSLATPQVAGVAALVLSRNPGLTGDQVRDVIQETANDLGSPGWDPFFGYGQINAYEAVVQARRGAGDPDPYSAVVDAVNQARQLRDLPALIPDATLMAATQQRAESLMAICMSSSAGNLASCLNQAGRTDQRQEVILVGVSSPQAVVDLLIASPDGQQLLFGPFWQIGVGHVNAGRSAPSQIWMLRFGQRLIVPRFPTPAPIISETYGR